MSVNTLNEAFKASIIASLLGYYLYDLLSCGLETLKLLLFLPPEFKLTLKSSLAFRCYRLIRGGGTVGTYFLRGRGTLFFYNIFHSGSTRVGLPSLV